VPTGSSAAHARRAGREPSSSGARPSSSNPELFAPPRGHGVEVIATALAQRLRGRGHRSIGQQLDVPESTVRGWLRRVARRAERLCGVATTYLYGPDAAQAPLESTGSALRDALAGLAVPAPPTRDWAGRCSGSSD
jgi:hypothetical protein